MPQPNYNLHLKGYVGGCDFDRNYVDYVLDKNKDKPVHVLIDSLGGSLATALSIASAFRAHGDVTVHFVGMNASAATVASLGAKHISMDSSAMYLVHKCSAEFFEWGNLNADQLAEVRDNCEAAIRDLNKLDSNIATMYAVASAMAAAGMPIPNIPTDGKETLFARFLASIAALFKPGSLKDEEEPESDDKPLEVNKYNNVSNSVAETMNQTQSFSLLGKVLNVEGFAVGENGVTLTEAQMQAIEDALAARDRRNTELADELAAVKKSPADTSTAVINEGTSDKTQPQDEVQSYVETCNQAKALYNLVP